MLSYWQILKRTALIWASHNATRLAAGVAFYAMLALAPLLVVAMNVLSLIYGHTAEQRIGQQVNTFLGTGADTGPGQAVQQILQIAADSKHGRLALIIGFIVALVSGSSLFAAIQDAIANLWDIKPRPDQGFRVAVLNRLVSGSMLFILVLLLIASITLSTIVTIIAPQMGGWRVDATYVGEALVSFVIVSALFGLLYRFLYPAKAVWSDVWLGALLTGGLFTAGRIGLTVYFRVISVHPYGAAGSLAALLIWVYYSSMLIFFGAAFTRVHAESRGKPIRSE